MMARCTNTSAVSSPSNIILAQFLNNITPIAIITETPKSKSHVRNNDLEINTSRVPCVRAKFRMAAENHSFKEISGA
jgi:hypothetical protein